MWKIKEQIKRPEYIVGGILLLLWLAFVGLYYIGNSRYKTVNEINIQNGDVQYELEIDSDDEYIYLEGWCALPGETISTVDISLILWDEGTESGCLIPVQREERTEVTEKLRDGYNYDKSGFSAIAVKDKLENADYKVLIQYRNNDNDLLIDTESVVEKW